MILVVSNYRTGSTTACQELADRHNYVNEDEIFSSNRSIESNRYEFDRLIRHSKKDVVIKVMGEDIVAADRFDTNFSWAVAESAEKIYYTIRLDFEAQCKSWFTSMHTDQYHAGAQNNTPVTRDMTPVADEDGFYEQCDRLLANWILIDQYYHKYPGEFIILENRNNPYTFNKEAINNTQWPDLGYVTQLTSQFNKLNIIKRSQRETISQ